MFCIPKQLPVDLQAAAIDLACECNPANRIPCCLPKPQHLAVLKSSYWGARGVRLGVRFLDRVSNEFKRKFLLHANAWNKTANVTFTLSNFGQVRVSLAPGGGHWSYLGTDILMIPAGQPTMNLDSITVDTPDSEWRRVVRHEVGHTLGFPHEHMRQGIVSRIDPSKAFSYFRSVVGWDRATVTSQVLTPVSESKLIGSAAEVHSIMCYQLPGSIMRDGRDVPGGNDIDANDFALAAKVYPK